MPVIINDRVHVAIMDFNDYLGIGLISLYSNNHNVWRGFIITNINEVTTSIFCIIDPRNSMTIPNFSSLFNNALNNNITIIDGGIAGYSFPSLYRPTWQRLIMLNNLTISIGYARTLHNIVPNLLNIDFILFTCEVSLFNTASIAMLQ